MATATSDADDIRLKMAQIRRDLHADVRDVVASAEAATDWRRYIRMYPWAALGVTFAVGYLIVPKRHPPAPDTPLAVVPVDPAEVRDAIASVKESEAGTERKGLVGMALGFLGPIALRAAQGYASQYLENWLAQQQSTQGGPPQGSSRPDRSGGTGTGSGAGSDTGRSTSRPPF